MAGTSSKLSMILMTVVSYVSRWRWWCWSLLAGVYTCYKPFLSRDKTLLKRLVKVSLC